GDERGLGTDHDEVGGELDRQREQALRILRADGVTPSVPRDPRIARRAVHLADAGAPRKLPRERVLAPARPDEEHLHAASLSGFEDGAPGAGRGGWKSLA